MESVYPIRAWSRSTENDIIRCIQEVFSKNRYETKNFHVDDRVHELGTDLECTKGQERIVFAVKKKPKKIDIKQLRTFAKEAKHYKKIYVSVEPATRPFEEVARSIDGVTFWNASRLHEELVKEESISYLCLLFSVHPIVDTLTQINIILYDKRKTSFHKRKLTVQELDKLWVAKDNVVKMRAMLLNVYSRWMNKLMTKTAKEPQEYQTIIDEVFEELDLINRLCGQKLATSFEEIAEKHPDLFGLYWDNVSQRTGWKVFTINIEKIPVEHVSEFVRLQWVMPGLSNSKSVMRGFYSTINYILENLHTTAKNLEDGIDWIFEDMR